MAYEITLQCKEMENSLSMIFFKKCRRDFPICPLKAWRSQTYYEIREGSSREKNRFNEYVRVQPENQNQ